MFFYLYIFFKTPTTPPTSSHRSVVRKALMELTRNFDNKQVKDIFEYMGENQIYPAYKDFDRVISLAVQVTIY